MKDNKLLWTIFTILVLWGIFFLIPPQKTSFYDAFISLGALFTGLAFAATYASLIVQNKQLIVQNNHLKEQIKANTFSNAINLILTSNRFRECRKYVMSQTFYQHVNELEDLLSKERGEKETDETERKVCIDDWKKLSPRGHDSETRDYEYYEMLLFFLGRMEYLDY